MKSINIEHVSAWLRTAGGKADGVIKAMADKAASLGVCAAGHDPIDPPSGGDPAIVNGNPRAILDWLDSLSEVPADCGEAVAEQCKAAQSNLGRLLATAMKATGAVVESVGEAVESAGETISNAGESLESSIGGIVVDRYGEQFKVEMTEAMQATVATDEAKETESPPDTQPEPSQAETPAPVEPDAELTIEPAPQQINDDP